MAGAQWPPDRGVQGRCRPDDGSGTLDHCERNDRKMRRYPPGDANTAVLYLQQAMAFPLASTLQNHFSPVGAVLEIALRSKLDLRAR